MTPSVITDEIVIAKDRSSIWSLVTDISRWSRWNRLIRRAAVYGPIKPGTEFKFLSGKWDFDGIIIEVSPGSSFIFEGKSIGIRLRFSCEIFEQIDGAKVTATITASGWIVTLFKPRVNQALIDDLFTWLYALKTTLERGEKGEPSAAYGLTKPKKKRNISGPLGFLFKQNKEDE